MLVLPCLSQGLGDDYQCSLHVAREILVLSGGAGDGLGLLVLAGPGQCRRYRGHGNSLPGRVGDRVGGLLGLPGGGLGLLAMSRAGLGDRDISQGYRPGVGVVDRTGEALGPVELPRLGQGGRDGDQGPCWITGVVD